MYLLILRAFYWVRHRFGSPLEETVKTLYLENRTTQSPFLAQSALHELLFAFQAKQAQVVFVLNHFDRFCQVATPQMLNTLRGLRDSFKESIGFIAGMVQEATYLPDPEALGDMLYELLNRHICWVGPMEAADARWVISQATHTAPAPPPEAEVQAMLALSGGFPALLRTTGYWWLNQTDRPPLDQWLPLLSSDQNIIYWLDRLWEGLTQEEQFALSAVCLWQGQTGTAKKKKGLKAALDQLNQEHGPTLRRLAEKGVCHRVETGWRIMGDLLADYIKQVGPSGRGRIRLDEKTEDIYQGVTRLENLTPQEEKLLRYMIRQPYRRNSYADLIGELWPDELLPRSKDDLFPLIRTLRKKLEVRPSEPRYIINWGRSPEGGYQFYPEGRPE